MSKDNDLQRKAEQTEIGMITETVRRSATITLFFLKSRAGNDRGGIRLSRIIALQSYKCRTTGGLLW